MLIIYILLWIGASMAAHVPTIYDNSTELYIRTGCWNTSDRGWNEYPNRQPLFLKDEYQLITRGTAPQLPPIDTCTGLFMVEVTDGQFVFDDSLSEYRLNHSEWYVVPIEMTLGDIPLTWHVSLVESDDRCELLINFGCSGRIALIESTERFVFRVPPCWTHTESSHDQPSIVNLREYDYGFYYSNNITGPFERSQLAFPFAYIFSKSLNCINHFYRVNPVGSVSALNGTEGWDRWNTWNDIHGGMRFDRRFESPFSQLTLLLWMVTIVTISFGMIKSCLRTSFCARVNLIWLMCVLAVVASYLVPARLWIYGTLAACSLIWIVSAFNICIRVSLPDYFKFKLPLQRRGYQCCWTFAFTVTISLTVVLLVYILKL